MARVHPIALALLVTACTAEVEESAVEDPWEEVPLTGVVRSYEIEVGDGEWRVVRDDGAVLAEFEGYHLNDQFIGPTLIAELGDTIEVTLVNGGDEPIGLQPHGLHYDVENGGRDRQAAPGEEITFTWYATEGAGTFFYNATNLDVQYFDHQALSGVLGLIVVEDPAERDLYQPDRMFNYVMLDLYEPGITFNWDILNPADEVHNFTLIPQVVEEGVTSTQPDMLIIGERDEVVRVNVLSYGEMYHVLHMEGHSWRDPHTGETADTWGGAAAESGHFYVKLDNPGTWRVGSNVDDRRMYMTSYLLVP